MIRMFPDEETRAQYIRDAQLMPASMVFHIFVVPREDARPVAVIGDALCVDGTDGVLLCGGDRNGAVHFVVTEGDELSRTLWENFPTRCPACVRLDAAKHAS